MTSTGHCIHPFYSRSASTIIATTSRTHAAQLQNRILQSRKRVVDEKTNTHDTRHKTQDHTPKYQLLINLLKMPPLGECILDKDLVLFNDESSNSFSSTLTTHLRLDKKPSVSFSETVLVGTTLNINDMTVEEYQSYWMDSHEFIIRSRSADISSELYEVMGKTHQADDGTCYRGLEARTTAAIDRYTEKYFEMITAVLDEQDVQRSLDFVDDERIATACRSRTFLCQQEALLRAKEDELAAVASDLR